MSAKSINKDTLKAIFNQISGTVKEEDELIPAYYILGEGYGWFFDPTQRMMIRVAKGTTCYILDGQKDSMGRIMVYTVSNDVILVEEEEISFVGYD